MEAIELVAAKRSATGKAVQQLRSTGVIPAVVYGHGVASEPIEIDGREMERVYAQAGGSKIVGLKVGGAKVQNVLIQDVQTGALRGELRHVDFYAVRMDEELTTEVPLHFVGESNAVFRDEGILLKPFEAVEITCLPANLPESIEVDLSVLDDFEKTITLADLTLPKGVKFTAEDLTQLVAKVDPPRSEEEMAGLEESVAEELPQSAADDQSVKESADSDKK